jgi:hypothetical protein
MKTAVILSLVALAMCTGQTEANIRPKLHRVLSSRKGCPSRWGRVDCARYCGNAPNLKRGLKCQLGYHVEFSRCSCSSVCVQDPPAHCRGWRFDEADEESVGGWERAIAYDENDDDEDVGYATPTVVGWNQDQFDQANLLDCHNGGSVGFCRIWCGRKPDPTKGLKCPPGQLVKYNRCACKSVCVKQSAHCR